MAYQLVTATFSEVTSHDTVMIHNLQCTSCIKYLKNNIVKTAWLTTDKHYSIYNKVLIIQQFIGRHFVKWKKDYVAFEI